MAELVKTIYNVVHWVDRAVPACAGAHPHARSQTFPDPHHRMNQHHQTKESSR